MWYNCGINDVRNIFNSLGVIMAFITVEECPQCKEKKQICHSAGSYQYLCGDCIKLNETAKHNAFIAERASFPIEQRLTYIEEWIYVMNKKFDEMSGVMAPYRRIG